MRRALLSLLAFAAWLTSSQPGAAQAPNAIINMPFIVGEVSIVASRCDLRSKVWATKLAYTAVDAIKHLDWTVVTPQTGQTEDSLMDRLNEGQQDAIRTLAADHDGTCAKLTPDRLARFDKIVDRTAPVF